MIRTALALLALTLPAQAHDTPPLKTPDSTVTVQQTLWPEFGRQAGEGRVRLVYHSPGVATRMGVNDFHAYERAYHRSLARLMMRMPLEQAEPIARHDAWHAVVGAVRGRDTRPAYRSAVRPD